MDKKLTDEDAIRAAKTLIQYCRETGCLYCEFVEMDGPDIDCDIRQPREWEVKKDE